jgi:lipopolysaccharide/colanic/teichoic acid biosynthesis glycosyltransferase
MSFQFDLNVSDSPTSQRYLLGLVKRSFDLVGAILLIPVAVPIILLMALAIRLESIGNPFFVQTRIGIGGKPFSMWKMRSLFSDKFEILAWDEELTLEDDRITKVGRFLRRTKLDELPQLFHVISGKMTLVGPRPDIPEQVAQYSHQQRERLIAKPGMTGIAQISGNTFLSWPTRIELDRWYLKNASLGLDLRILWQTLAAVWRGETKAFDDLGALTTTQQPLEEFLNSFHDDSDHADEQASNPPLLTPVE